MTVKIYHLIIPNSYGGFYPSTPVRVAVLGGGVAGMSAAHELVERGFLVLLARFGRPPLPALVNFPKTRADLATIVEDLTQAHVGLMASDKKLFARNLWQILTFSYERCQQVCERQNWWDAMQTDAQRHRDAPPPKAAPTPDLLPEAQEPHASGRANVPFPCEICCVGGLTRSLVCAWLGFPLPPWATFIYIGFSLANLLLTKRYALFTTAQLVAIMLNPLMAHVAIGGFVNSSAIILSAILSPLGALMFTNARTVRVCFGLFVVDVVPVGLWDYRYVNGEPRLPKGVLIVSFVSNLLIIYLVICLMIQRVLEKRDETE